MTTVWSAPTAAIGEAIATSAAAAAPRHRIAVSTTALAQRRLDVLRVLEMRHEGRPHLDQQRLQFGVLRTRDQGLVECVDDRLVVGDLVVDIRLVEGGSLQVL